jgi:4-amino-4-deoxy-L-arabinose transferase-like glycosyltransferase
MGIPLDRHAVPASAVGLEPVHPGCRKEQLALALITIALLVPFLTKPFHIDDPLYLLMARQIHAHPWQPYNFSTNYLGHPQPMWEIALNPPGMGYFLAALTKVFGEWEFPLHAVFLVFPLLAVGSAYHIARRFTSRPFFVALCFAVTPILVVSSTNLSSDVAAFALFLSSVALLLEALEGRRSWGLLSGVAAAAAVLTKYNMVFVIPLLGLAAILFDRRPWRHLMALLIPVAALLGWEAVNLLQFGHSHLLASTQFMENQHLPLSVKMTAAAAFLFLGAGSAPVFLLARLGERKAWIALVMAFGAALLFMRGYAAWSSRFEGASALWLLTTTAAAGGLACIGLALRGVVQMNRKSVFLAAWLVGALVLAVFFSHFVAARFIEPALLPAILLWHPHARRWTSRAAILLSAVLALLVASADFDLAVGYRAMAEGIHAKYGSMGGRLFFEGQWGLQYYFERHGDRRMNDRELFFAPGDRLVMRGVREGMAPYPVSGSVPGRFIGVTQEVLEYRSHVPITAMTHETGAGFYSSLWGPLPFSWGKPILLRYRVDLVVPAADRHGRGIRSESAPHPLKRRAHPAPGKAALTG